MAQSVPGDGKRAPSGAARLGRRVLPYLLPLLVALCIGGWACSRVLERAGEPAFPLDDSFIHLQYARRLAAGHWFRFSPGAAYSSGATSWLWAMLMVPFFWLGLDGLQLVWASWLCGMVLHAACMLEAGRLAHRLGGSTAAVGAAGLVAACGAFTWFGYSGMETVGLAWLLLRGARVAAARVEDAPGKRPSALQLVFLGLLAPLMRPEGAAVSAFAVMIGAWMFWRERRTTSAPKGPFRWRSARNILVPLLGPLIIPTSHYLFTGRASSSTAVVKWAALDPYIPAAEFVNLTAQNVRLLFSDLLNGGAWTRLFIPEHFAWPLLLSCAVVMFSGLGGRRDRRWSAALLLLGVAATMVPCTYSTLLWNRVRYIWPFAGFWLVAVAVGCVQIGAALARIRPLLRIVAPTLLGGAVAFFAMQLPWATQDLAQSARAISLQQVKLGRWAQKALPRDAIIGVNDTGAIAYFSERATFDVVGLTTQSEAPYWAEGAGSRFEHYEELPRADLPTHFIVYPNWMAMSAVLGPQLHSATVTEQSILGGATMVAYESNYRLLGTGSAPFASTSAGPVLDVLDVANLASERAHDYERLDAVGRFNRARVGSTHDGRVVADGGRWYRHQDRFRVGPLPATLMILRVTATDMLEIRLNGGAPLRTEIAAAGDPWDEQMVALPALAAETSVEVRSADGRIFDAYHYFWLKRQP